MTKISDTVHLLCESEKISHAVSILNEYGENCALIKGPVLSKQIYGAEGKRGSSTDVDILIPRSNIKLMESILLKQGYDCDKAEVSREGRVFVLSSSHQSFIWKKASFIGNIYVDINFDIFWGEYEGRRVDIDKFLLDTIEMEIYGTKVKTLPPIKAMIQLILHHYKDMNSIFLLATRKSIKYDMFKDVYYLLINNLNDIPLNRLYDMSIEYGILPYVFYILYYTGQVFEDTILKQYIDAFRTPEGEGLLNCYGLCSKERKEWNCDFITRLKANNLFDLIKSDLTTKDQEKIAINKRIFMGVSE